MQVRYALPGIAICHPEINSGERSDTSLIDSIAAGDKLAIRLLFARHSLHVHRFATRITGNASTAEDIVSEVFFDVWRQAGSFEARCRVVTWLLAIARHKAISRVRGRSELQLDEEFASTIADSADNPEESTDKQDRSDALHHCLKQLPPEQRAVVDLIYYHERSIAEVAAIVNAPESTVKTRMFYARKRLAELLAAKGIHTMCQ